MTHTTTTSDFPTLAGHEYMSLTTTRKSGQPVPTPVWFAQEGATLYVMTMRSSGKAKRISHTAQVTVAPCTRTGELLGQAVPAAAPMALEHERAAADQALEQKYGEQKKMFDSRLTDPSERVYLIITAE